MPLNTIPANLVQDWFKADIEEKQAKAEQARRPPPTPVAPTAPSAPRDDAAVALLTEARDTARRCAQEAEDAKDVIAAELAALRVELAHVQVELEASRSALVDVRATSVETAEQLRAQIAVGEQARSELHEREASAQAEIARLIAQATSLGTDIATASEDVEQVRSELAEAVGREQIATAGLDEIRRANERLEAERDVALAANLSRDAELSKLVERTESLSLDVAAAQQDTAKADARTVEADHRTAVVEATVAELRTQVATLLTDAEAQRTAHETVLAQVSRVEAERDAHLVALDAERESSRQAAASVVQMQTRLLTTQQAIRGTLVDAANRLIAKETERARKSQGSPQKLGAWVETFYPIHEDFCRVALKPAVRAMLIAQGVDADLDRVLDRIVLAHISESSRQLQGVLQDSDIESLPPALERVLRRWEAERADALADRIMKEAV